MSRQPSPPQLRRLGCSRPSSAPSGERGHSSSYNYYYHDGSNLPPNPRATPARAPAGPLGHARGFSPRVRRPLQFLHRCAPHLVGGLTLGADPVAYAIATAAWAQGKELDAFTVRKQAKSHGTGRRIEGCFKPGVAVVVVEDVITTGYSAAEAIAAITAEGGRVLGVLAVVDREEGGRAALEQGGHAVEALVTATELGLGGLR